MYKKGDWVLHAERNHQMRVERDVRMDEDPVIVWCEWTDGGYHLETYPPADLQPLDRPLWPQTLGRGIP